MEYKFEKGCLWEGGGFLIRTNVEITISNEYDEADICKHCHSRKDASYIMYDGKIRKMESIICPRVVVAYNEGGHNSTGVCLDCIIEASKTIEQ